MFDKEKKNSEQIQKGIEERMNIRQQKVDGMIENIDRREQKMNGVLSEQIDSLDKEIRRIIDDKGYEQMNSINEIMKGQKEQMEQINRQNVEQMEQRSI